MTAKHLLSEIVAGLDGVTEIPGDIMKTAEKAFKYGFGLRYEVAIKAIAQEIHAERERASRKAFEEAAQFIETNMICGPDRNVFLPRGDSGNTIGLAYAAALRARAALGGSNE
jgi:cellobiose-specific phosphotransferase system component IIC